MTAPRLLVLGAGRHQAPLIRRAEDRGIETVVVDPYEHSPGKAIASHTVLADAFDSDVAIEAAREHHVDGVTTVGTDQTVLVVARVAAAVGLPCHVSVEGALRATNKPAMRRALREAGVPMPDAVVSREHDGVVHPPAYPCVVKAADSQGQRGMTVVDDPADLPQAIETARRESRTRTVVIEGFRTGPEFTINAWMRDGDVESVSVLDRITYNPPPYLGICLQHVGPTVHAEHLDELSQIAVDVARAYDQLNGPLYIQTLATDSGFRVVEAASRVGGGHEAQLLPRLTGFDPIGRAIDLALDNSVPRAGAPVGAGGGLVNFIVARPGVLAELSSFDALVAEGVVDEGSWYVAPGYEQSPITDSMGRVGYFVVTADDRAATLERAAKAYASLSARSTDGEELIFWPDPAELNQPS